MSNVNLAGAIHFDESDLNVFYSPARTGEWCIPGGFEILTCSLAQHFVSVYRAPDIEAAHTVALDEMNHMAGICSQHDPNTLLTVTHELVEEGVRESFRTIESRHAGLEQFAVHIEPYGLISH